MTSKISLHAAVAATMISIPAMADARSLRAVGSSTVYPFAKMAAERVARANPKLGAPIIESTGTGAGFKLFCSGVGERFPDISNASRRMKASEAKQCAGNGVKDVTDVENATSMGGYVARSSLLTALEGASGEITRESVVETIKSMPESDMPGGGGMTFQCGGSADPDLPAVCTDQSLRTRLDAEGRATTYEVVSPSLGE